MGFLDHLVELRGRLLKVMLALVAGTMIGFLFAGPVLDYLRGPYCEASLASDACELVVLGPTDGIIVYFRVSLMLGGMFAIPVITYQLLMFIIPGMKRKERRVVLLSLPAITALFAVGVAFAWLILMPPALGFLESFQPGLFRPEWTADLYLSFVTALLFWMGVAFETPLVFFTLALLGLVSTGALLRNWRLAVIGASVAAALITPTIDPVNMVLVMGPLLALYALSFLLVALGRRMTHLDEPVKE